MWSALIIGVSIGLLAGVGLTAMAMAVSAAEPNRYEDPEQVD